MDILHNITWKQFLTILTICFMIYYAGAILLLIRQWLQNAKTDKSKKTTWYPRTEEIASVIAVNNVMDNELPQDHTDEQTQTIPPAQESSIVRFGSELEKLIDMHRQQPDKQMILADLGELLPVYPQLNTPLMLPLITAIIQKRFAEECNTELSATDIQPLWNNPLSKSTGSVVG